MDKEVQIFLIAMGFFIVGGLCGFAIHNLIIVNDFTQECNEQCNDYMREFCFCQLPDYGPYEAPPGYMISWIEGIPNKTGDANE